MLSTVSNSCSPTSTSLQAQLVMVGPVGDVMGAQAQQKAVEVAAKYPGRVVGGGGVMLYCEVKCMDRLSSREEGYIGAIACIRKHKQKALHDVCHPYCLCCTRVCTSAVRPAGQVLQWGGEGAAAGGCRLLPGALTVRALKLTWAGGQVGAKQLAWSGYETSSQSKHLLTICELLTPLQVRAMRAGGH